MVRLRLVDKGAKLTKPHQRLVHYLDHFAPKAPRNSPLPAKKLCT